MPKRKRTRKPATHVRQAHAQIRAAERAAMAEKVTRWFADMSPRLPVAYAQTSGGPSWRDAQAWRGELGAWRARQDAARDGVPSADPVMTAAGYVRDGGSCYYCGSEYYVRDADGDNPDWVGDRTGDCRQCGFTDGISDPAIRLTVSNPYCVEFDHAWVAGMMIVHPEDVATVAATRPVECERCEHVWTPADA